MQPEDNLIFDIFCKYEEWFETVPEQHFDALLINILAKMVIKEREQNEYYKRKDNVCFNTRNS